MRPDRDHTRRPKARHTLHISNMVCPRCIMAVSSLLSAEGLPRRPRHAGHGHGRGEIPPATMERIRRRLSRAIGFGLIDDPRDALAERIRLTIIDLCARRPHAAQPQVRRKIVARIGHATTTAR